MNRLIIATGNAHKAEEFARLLTGCDLIVESAAVCGGMPNVVEDGSTFEANAEIKARALLNLAPESAWVLADDSGLEVDFLDGAPGIYSARYAGEGASDEENVLKLLCALKEAGTGKRSARFRCVLCLMKGRNNPPVFFQGACEGVILTQPSGDSGFGYDPVFAPGGYHQSFAELGDELKHKMSHRSQASAKLVASLSS